MVNPATYNPDARWKPIKSMFEGFPELVTIASAVETLRPVDAKMQRKLGKEVWFAHVIVFS